MYPAGAHIRDRWGPTGIFSYWLSLSPCCDVLERSAISQGRSTQTRPFFLLFAVQMTIVQNDSFADGLRGVCANQRVEVETQEEYTTARHIGQCEPDRIKAGIQGTV